MASLKKDAAYVYGGYLLRYLSLLILIPYYGRVLGPTSYGQVLAAMSLMGIVWLASNFGFAMTGTRELALLTDHNEKCKVFGRQISGRLILAPVGIGIGVIGTVLSPTLSQNIWFGVLATALGLANTFNLGWLFQGFRKFRTSILIEVIAYPLNVIFILFLVRTKEDGVYALVGLLASSVISLCLAYVLSLRIVRIKGLNVREGLKEITNSGSIFLVSVNTVLMTTGSTYFLSILSTTEQVGYYGLSERIASVVLNLLSPMAQLLVPTISQMRTQEPEKALPLIRKGTAIEIAYGLFVSVGGVILAPFMIPFIFGKAFSHSIIIFQIMACMIPFAAFRHAMGLYTFVPLRKEKWLVISVAVGNVVNIAVACWLAPQMGGIGMAISRLGCETISSVMLIWMAHRFGLLVPMFQGMMSIGWIKQAFLKEPRGPELT